MDRKVIEGYLYNALQPDDNLRKEAEIKISELQNQNYLYFIQIMIVIFCDSNTNKQLKMIAGIILKNSLHSNDAKLQGIYENKWMEIDQNTRDIIKSQIIKEFGNSDRSLHILAGAISGFIARIEIIKNPKTDFFSKMKEIVVNESMAAGVFEAISICCESIINDTTLMLDDYSGVILDICLSKLEDISSSVYVKEMALKCLINCLEILYVLFRNKLIISRYLSCLVNISKIETNLNIKALICLNKFVGSLYDILSDSIPEIYKIYSDQWNSETEEIIVQVVEFWTILAEIKEFDFISSYLDTVIPNILKHIRKNSDYIDHAWNAHKACAYFLEVITSRYGCKIFFNPAIFNFISSNLSSTDKENIEIGAITLGCVTASNCEHQLINFIRILIINMKDPQIQESCLYAMTRICETNFYAVIEHLAFLINQTCEIIKSKLEIATSACWLLNSIFISMNKLTSNKLSNTRFSGEIQNKLRMFAIEQANMHFTYILQVLVSASESASLEESTFRVAIFTALTEIVRYTDEGHLFLLDEFIVYVLEKTNECILALSKASNNLLILIEDVLSNYVILSEAIIYRRKKDSVNMLLPSYMNILKSRPTSAIGEVYISVTTNISDFISHIDKFYSFIIRDLSSTDTFILKSAINLIGHMANSNIPNFHVFAVDVIPLLVQDLSLKHITKECKAQILSVFGDIAMALGDNFEPYIDMSMVIFTQIISLDRNTDEKYVDELRFTVVQMLDCIVVATSNTTKLREIIHKLVNGIKKLVTEANSENTYKALIGLISDLRIIYSYNFDLNGKWVDDFLHECLKSMNSDLRAAAQKELSTGKKQTG